VDLGNAPFVLILQESIRRSQCQVLRVSPTTVLTTLKKGLALQQVNPAIITPMGTQHPRSCFTKVEAAEVGRNVVIRRRQDTAAVALGGASITERVGYWHMSFGRREDQPS